MAWLAPTVEIRSDGDFVGRQYAQVTSERLLGTKAGAANLKLAVCVESAGWEGHPNPITTVMDAVALSAGNRVVMSMSGIVELGDPGRWYRVGLCGRIPLEETGWDWNGNGSTTVLVYKTP